MVDAQIVRDPPAQLLQPLHECSETSLRLRLVGSGIHEHADAPHPLALRARRDWPRRRRTAEQCDKLAPSHVRHGDTPNQLANQLTANWPARPWAGLNCSESWMSGVPPKAVVERTSVNVSNVPQPVVSRCSKRTCAKAPIRSPRQRGQAPSWVCRDGAPWPF
jgi:hypothetical protein